MSPDRAILACGFALVFLIIASHVPASVNCQLSTSTRTSGGALASPHDVFRATRQLLLDTLATSGHSGFNSLLEQSGVLNAIGSSLDGAPFTVFAPSDESIVRISPSLIASLQNPSNIETLRQVLKYHFVREKVSRFAWEGPWRTVQGESVLLHLEETAFTVSDVPVSKYAAAYSTSFVVHTTDGLLFPPSVRPRLAGADGAPGAAQLAGTRAAQGEGSGGGDEEIEEYEEDYEEDVWRRESLDQFGSLSARSLLGSAAPASAPSPSAPSSLSTGAIAGIVIGALAVAALVAALLYYVLVVRHKKVLPDPEEAATKAAAGVAGGASTSDAAAAVAGAAAAPHQPMGGASLQCQQYPLAVLQQATGGWAEERRIGSGGFADVYRAVDPADPSVAWAVKRGKVLTNDFKREIREMASKHHPNLVRLVGYCLDMDTVNERMEQILIYHFMHNGDLEGWIGSNAKRGLTLAQRLDVLIGAAHGLEYLHSFDIVHRDIKPANILLDRHMVAKVADFGLVRMNEGTAVNTTRILGTPGYVDPAYSRTRKATTATDVYSFGVVILEVITGRQVIVNMGSDNGHIKDWAEEALHAKDLSCLRDPQLDSPLPDNILMRAVHLAISCTLMPTAKRPTMSQVCSELTAIRQECFGVAKNRAAHKVDDELLMEDSLTSIPFEEQLASIEAMGSSQAGPGQARGPFV